MTYSAKPSPRPSLWFNDNAEEAINFYIEVFGDGEILDAARMPEGGPAPAGTFLAGEFRLRDQVFAALNGGPMYAFTPAVSFVIDCKDQEEVDYFWERFSSDGGREDQCGWVSDKFGLSWQVVPTRLIELLGDPNPARSAAAMQAMLKMQKIVIADLEAAADAAAEAVPAT
jgi:predicted 3-demethylubiquinone-9 3-methyltransferase (glyoxalase superfamily)